MEGLTPADLALIERVHADKLTMCNPNRCKALAKELRRVLRDGIPGDFVLCGVWRGGLAIIAASIFAGSGRKLYLFDTFEGMTAPDERDGQNAADLYKDARGQWCRVSMAEVLRNLTRYGLDNEPVAFVPGDVVRTMAQARTPEAVAVAYLDTDFYDSTRVELATLAPKISKGGAMFIDDYGTWPGCRAAVDEYFGGESALGKIDDGCRVVHPC